MSGYRVAGRVAAILLAGTLLGACGASATTSPVMQSPTAGGADAFPAGSWTASSASGSPMVVEFRSDGTWTFTRGGEEMSTGTYSTDKETITFLTDAMCREQNAEQGTYAWTYANDQLTLRKQDDLCAAGRVTTMDGTVWKPAK